MEAKIEQSTRMKIEDLNRSVANNKEAALSRLFSLVCDIKPELHENFRV